MQCWFETSDSDEQRSESDAGRGPLSGLANSACWAPTPNHLHGARSLTI